jgi:hypothetical protein
MRLRKPGRMAVLSVCTVALFIGLLPDGASAAGNARGVSTPQDEFDFIIGPGETYRNTNNLDCQAPCDFDSYNMTITAATSVRIRVLDCCILGDNICLAMGTTVIECAASPDFVDVTTPPLAPGEYAFRVGYRPPTPGGFPAGYDIRVDA